MKSDTRKLEDLDGIGKIGREAFRLLNVKTVLELSRKDPDELYKDLQKITGPQDICALDVFHCAVAQAKNPKIPKEQRQWWYWSRKRKGLAKK